jgi:hypothetical protein
MPDTLREFPIQLMLVFANLSSILEGGRTLGCPHKIAMEELRTTSTLYIL